MPELVQKCQSRNIEDVDLDQKIVSKEVDGFRAVVKFVEDMKIDVTIVHHEQGDSPVSVSFQLSEQS